MRITVLAVGRARAAAEQALCDVHWERAAALGGRLGFTKLDFSIVDVSRANDVMARMDDEAKKLSARIPASAHRIALDEAGRALSSEGLARHLASLRDRGVRDLVFLIGGPDGLAPALRESAEERLAFGPQTWPHLMVRAMLAEQVYRGFAILSGHPYHRGRA
ncbi:MAG TPA: 23S rRNA (pseudouridine(1915)-N(3))-methyltransferase RlmH [Micropepsaceae bacterium]|jgi:23S rRNA (pseudouridine1915-N3)-methyltransferase|nr:23S rRNA (pseudouridine(1915)-N(3))-methyltransferase RlmH [Micropepsaceae bacterium]